MDRSARSFFLTITVVYIVAFGVLLLYSLRQYPAETVLEAFRWRWVLSNGLSLFVSSLIPIQLFGVALTFSLFVAGGRAQSGGPFFTTVRPVLVIIVALAFIYTALLGLLQPRLVNIREETEYRSELAADFRRQGEIASQAGHYEQAVAEYEAYLSIDPENTEIEKQLRRAESERAQQRTETPSEEESFGAGWQVQDQSAADLERRAREAMEEDDYITAHYWARLALQVDQDREAARELMRRARERMASLDLSPLEERERRLFLRKQEAFDAWQNGDLLYAYDIFSDLAEEYPDDDDVERYLPQVTEEVRSRVFFAEDVEEVFGLPGSSDILFRTGDQAGSGTRGFVSLGRLVSAPAGTFARDIELFEIGVEGSVVRHLRAPYGKLQNGRFLLRGIARGTEKVVHSPEYLAGSTAEDRSDIVEITYSARELHAIADSGPSFRSAGVAELMRMEELYPQLGYDQRTVRLALAMRLVRPFSFVILSFFAVAAGWVWRKQYISAPPFPQLLLLPLLPFAIGAVVSLYHYLHRVLLGALLLAVDFTPTLIALVVLEGVLLVISLIAVAGQSTS